MIKRILIFFLILSVFLASELYAAVPSGYKTLNKKQNLICQISSGRIGSFKLAGRKQKFKRINTASEIKKLTKKITSLGLLIKSSKATAASKQLLKQAKARKSAIATASKRCLALQPLEITPTPSPTTEPEATPSATPAPFHHPSSILPSVKRYQNLGEFPVSISSDWKILSTSNQDDSFTAQYLRDEIYTQTEGLVELQTGLLEAQIPSSSIIINFA